MAVLKFRDAQVAIISARVVCPTHGYIDNTWVSAKDIQPGCSNQELVQTAESVMRDIEYRCRRCHSICEVD